MLRRQVPQVSCLALFVWRCMLRHACSLVRTAQSRCECVRQRGWMTCLRMQMRCWGYRTWLQTHLLLLLWQPSRLSRQRRRPGGSAVDG